MSVRTPIPPPQHRRDELIRYARRRGHALARRRRLVQTAALAAAVIALAVPVFRTVGTGETDVVGRINEDESGTTEGDNGPVPQEQPSDDDPDTMKPGATAPADGGASRELGAPAQPGSLRSDASSRSDAHPSLLGTRIGHEVEHGEDTFLYTIDEERSRAITSGQRATFSPDGTRLAFIDRSVDPIVYDIYVSRPNGSARVLVSDSDALAAGSHLPHAAPSWNPGGDRVTFALGRGSPFGTGYHEWRAYVATADGTDQYQLTTHAGSDLCPAWSPDGKSIAFVRDSNLPDQSGLYLSSPNGADIRRVWRPEGSSTWIGCPAWASDSRRIAFTEDDIVSIVDVVTQSTLRIGTGIYATWSPDGKTVAIDRFLCHRASCHADDSRIVLVRADDGKTIRVLAEGDYPTWSPDGRWLAFSTYDDSGPIVTDTGIHVVAANGTDRATLWKRGVAARSDWTVVP